MYITHVPYFRIQPDFSYSFETWRCLDRARGVGTNALKCDDMKVYLPMQPNHFHCCSQGLHWVLSTGCQKKWWSCRDSNAGRVISSNQNEQTSPRQVPDKSRKSLGKVPENPRKIHNFLLFFFIRFKTFKVTSDNQLHHKTPEQVDFLTANVTVGTNYL